MPAPPTPARAAPLAFFTRPSKWFARSASAPRVGGLAASPSGAGPDDPRASTSSTASAARKPKISRPTDPRPILDVEGYKGVPGNFSSLPTLAIFLSFPYFLSFHHHPRRTFSSGSPGLVRGAGYRGCRRIQSVAAYRGRADSLGTPSMTSTPTSGSSAGHQQYVATGSTPNGSGAGANYSTTPTTPLQMQMGMSTPMTIDAPAPFYARRRTDSERSGRSGTGHTRSHSFTPKLSSRLAGMGGGVASPGRKGSAGELEVDGRDAKEGKEKRGVGVSFPFFGGAAAQTKALPATPSGLDGGASLLAPPHIILEPASPAHEPGASRASTLQLHAPAPSG
ncbi:hypothetical protein B0H11DRAFT_1870214, partial [Mycena galericulata]